jgi:DNA-binding NarL/FixJ family response regulator
VAKPLPDPLSQRELEVLRLLASGASKHEITGRLVLAPGMVKLHVSHILSKCRGVLCYSLYAILLFSTLHA